MAAIAQTLDGQETFETKKELFDYVISQFIRARELAIIKYCYGMFRDSENQTDNAEAI